MTPPPSSEHPAPPKQAGIYTVITFGTFDLFHVGHQRVIERARNVAEERAAARGLKARLVVGVSSDALNRKKKMTNTIVPGNERLVVVSGLKVVDDVFFEESLDLKCDYVNQFHADCLVMGSDHAGRFAEVEPHGCSRVFLPRTEGISTTDRVLGIIENQKLTEAVAKRRQEYEDAVYANLILELAQSKMTDNTVLERHDDSTGALPNLIDTAAPSEDNDKLPLEPRLGKDGTYTVITFGTYDLFHVGHLQFFERARAVAEQRAAERGLIARMVVGVSSDAIHHKKKSFAPIVPLEERMGIVAGLKSVDEVFSEKSLEMKRGYVRQFGAECLVMGYDHEGRFAEVEPLGCSRVFLSHTPGVSTNDRIQAIAAKSKQTEEANRKRKEHEKKQYAELAKHEAERLQGSN